MGTHGADLLAERPLLLDPCHDEPNQHLEFHRDGQVFARTERGAVTIETFALNRRQLVALRQMDRQKFMDEIEQFGVNTSVSRSLIKDEVPFAAMRRSLLEISKSDIKRERNERRLRGEQSQRDRQRTQYTVGPGATDDDLAIERSRTRYIERVTLKNIGVHASLVLNTASISTATAPWMMLLGENGVGKSTLLKAIAFALSSVKQRRILGEHALSIVPRDGKRGTIAIHYTDGEVVKMTIDAGLKTIETNFLDRRFRLLALGATRLSPTKKRRPPEQPPYGKVLNLFDPFCPLEDSVDWLQGLPLKAFGRAGAALKALLGLPDAAVFVRRRQHVVIRQGSHSQDVRTLSDGYQTIIGVACAIMSTLVPSDLPVETAEGIVLIDEIGNHLHPTWRMRIVRGLKAAFPRVQFIATTHEPLCLRGLEDGEIAVLLRSPSHRSMLIDQLPPVRGLLVDQILSSAHFGLGSTIDPEIADKFEHYYRLLAKSIVSTQEKAELERLEVELNRIRLIGNTPSEQILLRTIDKRVARANKVGSPLDPGNLPRELEEELQEVLELATGGGAPKGRGQ